MPSSSNQLIPASGQSSELNLIDFIYSVPSPVTTELVALSPYICCIRRALEIISWKSHWTESWLVLGVWWTVCLLAYPGLRYFLPTLLLSAIIFNRWKPFSFPRSAPPITEKNLQSTISDLTTIRTLLPRFASQSLTPTPFLTLMRIALITYLPYIVLTHFVPLRLLIGLSGAVFLTWRANWSQTTRHILWKSALIRWCFHHFSSYLTGNPLPPKTLSIETTQATLSATDGPANSVRFLFTIYENQRWWMGLDWTAALLPAERPSWCSAAQTAVSPPNAFSLPPPAVSFLPASTTDGTKGNDGKGRERVKRTARWSWEEPEWRVMIRKDGTGTVSRVERPLPSDEKDSPAQISGRIFKGVGKKKEWSDLPGGVGTGGKGTGSKEEESFEGGDDEDGLIVTDPDGWVYGDNKWEGGSARGGLGKYTRYRRWTRIAVLTETIEIVDAGDFGVLRTNIGSAQPQDDTTLSLPSSPTSPTHSKQDRGSTPVSPTSQTHSQDPQSPARGMLRQRLKAVVDGV